MLKRGDPVGGPQTADGIGDLVHRLIDDGKVYARAEVEVYKTMASDKLASIKMPVILLVSAIFLGHAAFLALVATVFVALAQVMNAALAGVVTVLILAVAAGVAGYLGASKLSALKGADTTVRS